MNKSTTHKTTSFDLAVTLNGGNLKKMLGDLADSAAYLTDIESQVQLAWIDAMKHHWKKLQLGRYYNCDAYVQANGFAMLIEFKTDIDQSSTDDRSKVLSQVITYYAKILEGKKVCRTPDVLFVADINECFVLHVNWINKFVKMIDKNLPANRQHENAKLVNALTADKDVNDNTMVYHVNDADFAPEKIFTYVEQLAKGIVRVVPITASTFKKGFEFFVQKILKSTKDMSFNEQAGRYYAFIKAQDTAVIANGKLMGVDGYAPVAVNETLAKNFKIRFGILSEDDKQELERFYDTLLGERERRYNGQFFTPEVWVNEAHRRMANTLGENWEADTMTWDCCCGTKSLTRDWECNNLWLSTLDRNELSCSESLNQEARKTFVFDFLNGNTATLPKELIAELKANKNRPVAFLINPPYGQATSGRANKHKENISNTATLREMKDNGLGKPGLELTVQFLWRIMALVKEFKLSNVVLGLYSNPNWMTGDSFAAFRKEWCKMAKFVEGFAFRSEEFAGVKAGWAINFSVWQLSYRNNGSVENNFQCDIMERTDDGMDVAKVSEHTYYNLDSKTLASEWVRGPLPKTKKTFATTDGISIMDSSDSRCRGAICEGALGYMASNGNQVDSNAQYVALFSLPMSRANGFNLLPENIDRAMALFSARRLVKDEVWNHQDSYMAPNTAHISYSEYVADSYVLSIMEDKSNQTSIKGTHNGQDYEFKNQFFPFSKLDTYEMLGWQHAAKNFKDETRWCLENGKFIDPSPEGKRALDAFKRCLIESAPMRDEYGKTHDTLQLTRKNNRWDAGYRQLKGLFEEACPEAFAELKAARKALQAKMLPMVYELGFLNK